jgi:DNA-binding transcriptional MerR regulator
MTSTQLATLLDTSEDTIRRWSAHFAMYFSPSANPPKGEDRAYTERDVRIMAYISALRNMGNSLKTIAERLETTDLDTLPEVPGWERPEPAMIPAEQAGAVLEVAQLRSALRSAEQERDRALAVLTEAKERVTALEQALEAARQDTTVHADRVHQLQIELAEANGRVAALEGQLQAYSLAGRQVGPVALVGIVLVAALILVVTLLVIARLL